MNLTPKQKLLLEFIKDFSEEKGFAPSQWEIARHFGFKSLGTVQDYLTALKEKGHISQPWNGRRAIQLRNLAAPSVRIPMAGIVAAGRPIEAVEQNETVEVPPALLRGGENFGLIVKGDSMIEEGIRDGDLVVVRKQKAAENGQTVVAMIDGEATVKKLHKKKDRIELHPAHPTMKPILVTSGQGFQILGVVVGLIRKYG